MSRQGLRTILCCSVSGAGLWVSALGLLTAHVTIALVGAIFSLGGSVLLFARIDQEDDQ